MRRIFYAYLNTNAITISEIDGETRREVPIHGVNTRQAGGWERMGRREIQPRMSWARPTEIFSGNGLAC